MLQAMLSSVASVKAQQTKINVIGNNLANVNTTAFKGNRVSFGDMMSQTTRGATRPTEGRGGTNSVQYGLGVMVTGTDTNIALTAQSKGTGAINLAPGSSGVNISNGGTVTAITRTAAGTSYTSIPTLTVSPPTTAGGVQATATPQMAGQTVTVQAAGTGYVVGNTLTVVGGTSSVTAQLRVDAINGSGGVTATSFVTSAGAYSVLPTNPVSVTGGAGSGATFNITQWFFASVGPIITNAGSGYVEQPTVTFSGGGGSGAAAYATVGSDIEIRSLGTNLNFRAPNQQIAFQISDFGGSAGTGYWRAFGGNAVPLLRAIGATAGQIQTGSAVPIQFSTNASTSGAEQLRVAHTASAVNYVQVIGAATGNEPQVSAQGSDTNVTLQLAAKGVNPVKLLTGGSVRQAQVTHTASAVNYINFTGSIATAAPVISSLGTDTNIDLALTPKGTGLVRFGTRTATSDVAITGYLEIKDSGGTTRKLAIID